MDEKREKRRLDALGSMMTCIGWTVMSAGLGMLVPAVGVAVFGLGVLILGLAVCAVSVRRDGNAW